MSDVTGTNESPDIILAPMASNNLPVGIREERPTFLMLELESNSVRKASYLSFSSVAYGRVTMCSLSKPSDLCCIYLICQNTIAVQMMRIMEIANCRVTNAF